MVNTNNSEDLVKVWVYQADRDFTMADVSAINHSLRGFVHDWSSHDNKLSSEARIVHNRFIVLIVDENYVSASGCSIDTSVNFIKELGRELHIDFFNRMEFAYFQNEHVRVTDKQGIKSLYADGQITEKTLFFNNLVNNKTDFDANWLTPLSESWLVRFIK